MSDSIREAFERHCPMSKGLVFNTSLNRYDGGVYTNALSYNDMWCAWQYAWQAALQSGEPATSVGSLNYFEAMRLLRDGYSLTDPLYTTPQPVVDVNKQLVEALQAVLDCGSTSDQWWIDKAREALLSAGKENNNE
jgi:hypothetical protein